MTRVSSKAATKTPSHGHEADALHLEIKYRLHASIRSMLWDELKLRAHFAPIDYPRALSKIGRESRLSFQVISGLIAARNFCPGKDGRFAESSVRSSWQYEAVSFITRSS